MTETLELLTSEVVGNAVIHGQGPISLTISAPRPAGVSPAGSGICRAPQPPANGVLVQVHDASTHRPKVQPLTFDLTGGRGLAMVELLARQWGVSPPEDPNAHDDRDGVSGTSTVVAAGTGKTVWFVLSA